MQRLVLVVIDDPQTVALARRLPSSDHRVVLLTMRRMSSVSTRTWRGSCPDALLVGEGSIPSAAAVGQAVTYVRELWPDTRVLVVGDGDIGRIILAAQGGASGYVWRGATSEELADMLSRAARPEHFVLSPGLAARHRGAVSGIAPDPGSDLPLADLTPRERQIAALAAQGMTNRDLSESLRISVETAKWHVKNALHKLDLRDRAQLAARWHSSAVHTAC